MLAHVCMYYRTQMEWPFLCLPYPSNPKAGISFFSLSLSLSEKGPFYLFFIHVPYGLLFLILFKVR